jgi:uncharacterized membrane protein
MKILIAGESWFSYGIHVKGFGAYYTGSYDEGGKPLLEALEEWGHDVEYLRNHEAVREFPNTVEQLGEYDAVVLSDIGADALLLHPDVFERFQTRLNPLEALAGYVRQGGGLLMVGGYMSFSGFEGKANYHHTAIAELLPVTLTGYDDRVEKPEGCVPEVIVEHDILAGMPTDWPHFLGYNKLSAKPGAQVLLAVENDPFLVVAPKDKGRVAAFASDCAPHWGTPEFVEWEHYARFWNQLIGWVAGEPAHHR